jgi:hypothetical protein
MTTTTIVRTPDPDRRRARRTRGAAARAEAFDVAVCAVHRNIWPGMQATVADAQRIAKAVFTALGID